MSSTTTAVTTTENLTDNAITNLFETFFRNYNNLNDDFKYMNKIMALPSKSSSSPSNRIIEINHTDLPENLSDLFFKTTKFEHYCTLAKEAVESIYMECFPKDPKEGSYSEELDGLTVRILIDDPLLVSPMKEVDIRNMNRVVLFDATISSTSEVKSALKDRKYRCQNDNCSYLHDRPVKSCGKCKGKDVKFSLLDSKFTKYQLLELQERQDDRSNYTDYDASLPMTIDAKCYGNMVNTFRAGDNVRVTGFVKLSRAVSDKSVNADIDTDFSTDILFDVVVEVHNMQMLTTAQDEIVNNPRQILSEEDIQKIKDFRKKFPDTKEGDEKLINVLVNSFASFIFGYQTEKSVIIHQLVGSNIVELNEFTSKRPDIHVLFIGDPGTTKTSLLQEAAKLSIHGIYTSGKGSSGVGLTASVDKDGKGINRLKVGAAVMADKGLCCVDELLHINEDDRSYLLECMESGRFSIHKSGIHAQLNTRTSFLMATNAENGKYNPYVTLKENVPIKDQLWSRFDYVGVMRDIPNTNKDNKIADHLIKLYYPKYDPVSLKEDNDKQTIIRNFLFKYLVFAKSTNTSDISFTPEAINIIKDFYNKIRQPEKETDVTATPRQLEGIIRFCIARARLKLRNIVQDYDAIAVMDMLTRGFESCGMMIRGSEAKGLDMTAEYSKPLNKLSKPVAFKTVVLKLTKGNKEETEKENIITELVNKAGWSLLEANDWFDKMYIGRGELIQVKPGYYKLTNIS